LKMVALSSSPSLKGIFTPQVISTLAESSRVCAVTVPGDQVWAIATARQEGREDAEGRRTSRGRVMVDGPRLGLEEGKCSPPRASFSDEAAK
jgi:hypothetical protein